MTEEEFLKATEETWNKASAGITEIEFLVQIVALVLGYGLARVARPKLENGLTRLQEMLPARFLQRLMSTIISVTLPALWLLFQFIVLAVIRGADYPTYLLSATCSLLLAWIVIHVFTHLIQNTAWARLVALCVWSIAALNIVGFLTPTLEFLDSLSFSVGSDQVSMLKIAKGVVASIIVFWISLGLSKFAETRINKNRNLTPSVQVLMAKLVRVALIAVAVLIVLSNAGIDITAFAVFGSALAVGIGFGLQKVVSNLISGIILLLDRSIKPGDVIEVGQTYGRVHSVGARYASVITRDSMEFLIPNEDLITQQVVNWSYSSKNIRLRCGVGVAYGSDIPVVIKLVEEAAVKVERILSDPPPRCLMRGFGENAIDLELRFWIADPEKGCGSVISDALINVWQSFHDNGIDIPFPQREVRVEMIDKQDQ